MYPFGNDLVERNLVANSGGADLALDNAPSESFGSHGELHGHPQEVGVGELDARTCVAIVVQDFDTR